MTRTTGRIHRLARRHRHPLPPAAALGPQQAAGRIRALLAGLALPSLLLPDAAAHHRACSTACSTSTATTASRSAPSVCARLGCRVRASASRASRGCPATWSVAEMAVSIVDEMQGRGPGHPAAARALGRGARARHHALRRLGAARQRADEGARAEARSARAGATSRTACWSSTSRFRVRSRCPCEIPVRGAPGHSAASSTGAPAGCVGSCPADLPGVGAHRGFADPVDRSNLRRAADAGRRGEAAAAPGRGMWLAPWKVGARASRRKRRVPAFRGSRTNMDAQPVSKPLPISDAYRVVAGFSTRCSTPERTPRPGARG